MRLGGPGSGGAVPYKIHTVLTDNGTHFTTPGNVCSAAQEIKECLARGEIVWAHAFERACDTNDIDHRLTKPKHPWTNGQVEQVNRTLKEATVRRYHYDSHNQLRGHLAAFLAAYNFAKRLKTLRGLFSCCGGSEGCPGISPCRRLDDVLVAILAPVVGLRGVIWFKPNESNWILPCEAGCAPSTTEIKLFGKANATRLS